MNRTRCLVLLAVTALIGIVVAQRTAAHRGVPTVSIRHLSTVYANSGMCVLRFGLGTSMGDGDVGEVTLQLKFLDPKGRELHHGEIGASLDDTEGGRYQEVSLEDQNACFDSSTRVQVVQAVAEHAGSKFDLLKLHKLVVDDFRPMTIIVPEAKDR